MVDEVWSPVNLAIVIVTAAQRFQRGEAASALSLIAAAADIALQVLVAAAPLPASARSFGPEASIGKATARNCAGDR